MTSPSGGLDRESQQRIYCSELLRLIREVFSTCMVVGMIFLTFVNAHGFVKKCAVKMITACPCASVERFIYLVTHSGNLSIVVTVYTNCNLSGRCISVYRVTVRTKRDQFPVP